MPLSSAIDDDEFDNGGDGGGGSGGCGGGSGGDGGDGRGRESHDGVGGGRGDDSGGYNDDRCQRWRRLLAPVPIDGAR